MDSRTKRMIMQITNEISVLHRKVDENKRMVRVLEGRVLTLERKKS